MTRLIADSRTLAATAALTGLALADLYVLSYEDWLALTGDPGTFGMLFLTGFALWLLCVCCARACRRDRWSALALLALIALPVAAGCLAGRWRAARWARERPGYTARRDAALARPGETVAAWGESSYTIRSPEHGVRVVTDGAGRVFVSFVRYRVGIDNGMAYVYDPQDLVQVELGHERSGAGDLGMALSGIGVIGGIEPLGGHWYRCYFT